MQVALKGIEELSQHCDSLSRSRTKVITVLAAIPQIHSFRPPTTCLQAGQGIADLSCVRA